jgi:diguanylate cyclase (GGDEF)-like protein
LKCFHGLPLGSLRKQATLDPLTVIANRRYFSERALRELKRSNRDSTHLSILMCDVDNFKDYKDHYGHVAGDAVLKQVARSICQSARRPGDFCARFGGEEFILILSKTSESGALKVAQRIVGDIVELNIAHKKTLFARITVSIGTSTKPGGDATLTLERLIQQADSALYAAKESGKNKAVSFNSKAKFSSRYFCFNHKISPLAMTGRLAVSQK